jgi:hypothetical protein
MKNRQDPETHAELVPLVLGAITDLNDNLAQLRRGIASRDSNQRRGANYTALPTGGTGVISYSAGYLAGWSIIETSGNAGYLQFLDGDADGELLAVTDLLTSAGDTRWLLPHGIGFTRGLYVVAMQTGATAPAFLGDAYTSPVR